VPFSRLAAPAPDPLWHRLSYEACGAHADLHSFPTRRSSDLRGPMCRSWSPCVQWQSFFVPTRSSSPPASSCAASSGPCCLSARRSEEHTSELQSRENLVCRPLLEKKKSK